MDDAMFLRQCGIEVDARWLMEFIHQGATAEISNYVQGLMRIADMLGQFQIPLNKSIG
jgi:hypothetical protein